MVKLLVNVPQSILQATKNFTLGYQNYQNGTGTFTLTVNPDTGYDAMSSVKISYAKKNISPSIYAQSTNYNTTESGVYYSRIAYTAPSSDNSTTSSQKVMEIRLSPTSTYNYFALNSINCYMKIQHKTITSNGTYYPYDNMTAIKKIIVNVPTANNTTLTITTNGTYTPDSPYTGFSSVTVNVPSKLDLKYISMTYSVGSELNNCGVNLLYLSYNGTYISIPSTSNRTSRTDAYYSAVNVFNYQYNVWYFYVAKIQYNTNEYKYLIGCGVSYNGNMVFPKFYNYSYSARYLYTLVGYHNNHNTDINLESAVLLKDANYPLNGFNELDSNYSLSSLIQFPKGNENYKYLVLDGKDFNFEF